MSASEASSVIAHAGVSVAERQQSYMSWLEEFVNSIGKMSDYQQMSVAELLDLIKDRDNKLRQAADVGRVRARVYLLAYDP